MPTPSKKEKKAARQEQKDDTVGGGLFAWGAILTAQPLRAQLIGVEE
jgi:hypothetical protein